ncbi:hypothetical protein RJT34_06976 [Clitoria ternatea]|uniref:Uncharacterized protein n=1 Tax=Clitoria ternatea TaxID=43366 RepID=A0AAN9K4U2_CLITE
MMLLKCVRVIYNAHISPVSTSCLGLSLFQICSFLLTHRINTAPYRNQLKSMGRGVSSGGGQSSLGYLFGSGEAPTPAKNNAQPEGQAVNNVPPPSKPDISPAKTIDPNKPAGINSHSTDGQNTGTFITDRPSTKVHAAPGGGSSLGYLFGGPGEGK